MSEKMWNYIVILSLLAFADVQTNSYDIRGLISGNSMASIPLGMSLGSGELDVEGVCTRSGMACQNCTIAVTCVPLPVGWLKVLQEECQDGYTCNAHLGSCSKEAVPECSKSAQEFDHSCEQVGIFPDAYDCRKFHLCSPPEGMPDGRPADHRTALCPRHYGYNPQTAQCSIKLENGQCRERTVPECKTIGQNGALTSSTNHYYVCLMKSHVLQPQIFICPHGWHFWGGFCQPEPKPEIKDNATKDIKDNVMNDTHNYVNEKNKKVDENKDSKDLKEIDIETTTPVTDINSFFSTEKPPTYAKDTFLADRFDLSNYETTDDVQPPQQDDFINSFEENDFW